MPVMTGSIWGQDAGYRIVTSGSGFGAQSHVDEVSLNLHFRDITADSALSLLSHTKKGVWAECGFSSINSFQEGIEDFNPGVPRVVRRGVGFLTFRTAVVDCQVRSRWSIFFWTRETAAAAPEVAELQHAAAFLGYDRDSGDVVYTHQILREPGAQSEDEAKLDPEYQRCRIARDFAGRRIDVMKAPEGFQLQEGIHYRVDPTSKTIEAPAMSTTFSDFARTTL